MGEVAAGAKDKSVVLGFFARTLIAEERRESAGMRFHWLNRVSWSVQKVQAVRFGRTRLSLLIQGARVDETLRSFSDCDN